MTGEMQQIQVYRLSNGRYIYRTCWVEYNKRMQPGWGIKFKDGDGKFWTVNAVYQAVKPSDIKHGWTLRKGD